LDDKHADNKRRHLQQLGVCVEHVSADEQGRPDLHSLLRYLAQHEVTSLMIEGGSTVNGTALAAAVVDKISLHYAPRMLGEGAVPFSRGPAFSSVSLRNIRIHRFGEDCAIEGYLRDPYAE
jgi:diaminohydroxyphosphoribosylaminopyrimidine deaminase/5-amino-6-(5-phosphoribosylamino)uracil reductase